MISSSLYLFLYEFRLPYPGTVELKDWMVALILPQGQGCYMISLAGALCDTGPALILVVACSVSAVSLSLAAK